MRSPGGDGGILRQAVASDVGRRPLSNSGRPMRRTKNAIYTAALLGAALLEIGAVDAQQLVFASAADARRVLSSRDAFVELMSPFDRAARMKSDRRVTEAQYLEFAGAAALDWEAAETRSLAAAFDEIRNELMQLRLPLPAQIMVIKTTGREEGDAAYTRANAVVLPRRLLGRPPAELQRLLAHELFHVASRASPALAESLYEAIGFSRCGEAVFPPTLSSRKITNPDAPRNDYCIRVKVGEQETLATPILFSRSESYDRARGGEFFEYLQLALLLRAGSPTAQPSGGDTRVVGLQEVSGFFEQVGRNTEYIIHPEEILADNFAMLVLATANVPSPDVLTRVRNALANLTPQP